MILITNIPASYRSAFEAKVISIANKLKVSPDWLMMKMYMESRFNPAAHNTNGDASGLIQFMPSTLTYLGWNYGGWMFRKQSAITQLDWVYKYYKRYTGKLQSFTELAIVTFFPIALGKPDSFILQANNLSASAVANANKALDLNNDGQITLGEYKMSLRKRVATQYLTLLFPVNTATTSSSTLKHNRTTLKYTIAALAGVGIGAFLDNIIKFFKNPK